MIIAGTITLAIAALAAYLYLNQEPSLRGSVIDPPMVAPEISLTGAAGRPLDIRALEGNVVLLFFGYTNCPDVCPLTMANLKRAKDLMGADAERARVVMVTTDPVRDTPEQLAAFVSRFDPGFVGLTDSPERLEPVWKAYGVTVMDGGETHSSYVYVIDPMGRLVETLAADADPAAIAADVKTLLQD
jgi:protein SCO1